MATSHACTVVLLAALMLPVTVQCVTAEVRLIARARRSAGMASGAADTIQTLDTNGNGKVDRTEIAAFARAQGLASEEVLADFKELDINHDDELDPAEIAGLLGEEPQDFQTDEQPFSTKRVEKVSVEEAEKLPPPRQQAKKVAEEVSERPLAQATGEQVLQQEREDVKENEPPAQVQSVDNMLPSIPSLSLDAQHEADGALAVGFARRAQQLLARSAEDERKASAYALSAKALRGNATALIRRTSFETREAAKEATERLAQSALDQVKKLQAEAAASASGAEERRKKAKEAMHRVLKAQAALHSASESTSLT